jgi:beta-lactamase class A
MKRILILILLVSGFVNVAEAQQTSKSLKKIETKIKARLQNVDGDFAVAFYNLDKPNEQLYINARENFHAASTMKTPVMIEVFRQAEEGKFSLKDSIFVKNDFKSIVDGSSFKMNISEEDDEILYKSIGKKKTIYDLVYEMITVSSNLATNILIDLVDAQNVKETMRKIGAMDIEVLRGVEDIKAFEKGLNNTTTAYDLMLIFKWLANEGENDEMLNILFDQKFKDIIPVKLSKEVKVAHKTGSITGVRHDSGIIYLPDGRRYVLVLLSKKMKEPQIGKQALSDVSLLLYDHMLRKSAK